jgi:hypothetical protein
MRQKYGKFLLITLLMAGVYFFTRLISLTQIPIFTDEAIYIRWAEITRFDPYWRFIPLSDGKQPLFVWLMMVLIPYFKDPLFAGRLVSVLVDAGSVVGLFLLGKRLFQKNLVGWLTAGLYLLYPFALVYDRMALMDGLVGMFAIWSLYFQILLVETLRLDVALLLGMIVGGSILTKSSGFFNLYLLPFSLVLFSWQDKKRGKKLLRWLGLALVVLIISQAMYLILRLSPLFHMIGQKNTVFIYSFKEFLSHPFQFWRGNLSGLWDWLITYLSWPILLILLFSLLPLKKFFFHKGLLLFWFTIPFMALAFMGRVLYPRFIFFMTLSLLPLVALGLEQLKQKIKKPVFVALVFLFLAIGWLRTDFLLLTNPYIAPIPNSDKGQYLNDWPAGGGVKEVVEFLNQQSKEQKIYVATEGTFGPLPYALEVYLFKNHNVEIKGFWPLKEEIPIEATSAAQIKPTYFVFNQTQELPSTWKWPIKFIAKYRKGIGNTYLQLYQVMAD